MSCVDSFDNLCRRIVSPTRYPINEKDLIKRKFRNQKITYETYHIPNHQNEKLSIIVFPKDFDNLPTVVYLHGNGGHKLQALQLAGSAINLVAFDFSACGKSEGNQLTYGQKQVKDVETVVQFIKKQYEQTKLNLCLWGRSMGASIALMYCSLHQSQIYALVLDSPFSSLKKVMSNVAKHTSNNILPDFIINIALYFVQNKVNQISQTNIFSHDYSMHLNLIERIPIIFTFSTNDSVVKEEDVRELYDTYRGPKNLIQLSVQHHEDRPKDFIQFAINFIQRQKNQYEWSMIKKSSMTGSTKKGISLSNRKTLKESI